MSEVFTCIEIIGQTPDLLSFFNLSIASQPFNRAPDLADRRRVGMIDRRTIGDIEGRDALPRQLLADRYHVTRATHPAAAMYDNHRGYRLVDVARQDN